MCRVFYLVRAIVFSQDHVVRPHEHYRRNSEAKSLAVRMNSPNLAGLEDKTFLVLIVAVTLAFAWILWPFYGSVFWGTVLAILFAPPYRRLLTSMGRGAPLLRSLQC